MNAQQNLWVWISGNACWKRSRESFRHRVLLVNTYSSRGEQVQYCTGSNQNNVQQKRTNSALLRREFGCIEKECGRSF